MEVFETGQRVRHEKSGRYGHLVKRTGPNWATQGWWVRIDDPSDRSEALWRTENIELAAEPKPKSYPATFEGWFFSLPSYKREELFLIFDLPIEKITSIGMEELALKWVLEDLKQ